MCGIAGFFAARGSVGGDIEQVIVRMSTALQHRGPDDSGAWIDLPAGVAMGHRRLSIIDLSAAGHQPMISASGRYVLTFNGEIYNHETIRADLVAHDVRLRGASDTEVLLESIDRFGLMPTLERANGMFAFGLWDRQEQTMHLARDRIGEKPLYYGSLKGALVFASELKALCTHPDFTGDIDRDSLASFMRHGYVPTPYSIYRGVFKLAPGTLLSIRRGEDVGLVTPRAFWSARAVAEAGLAASKNVPEAELIDGLEQQLRRAVRLRMAADVPLGAFLSGGLDSSAIVALMQAQSSRPIRTFTIGFHETEFDEAVFARQVAAHLGTDHSELYVSPADAQAVIPKLPGTYDEPFADSSQIPTLLVAELARSRVTVALSGDGGDEMFGGYVRYIWGTRIWQLARLMPLPLRAALSRAITRVPARTWDAVLRPLPIAKRAGGHRIHGVAKVGAARNSHEAYLSLVSHWKEPNAVVIGGAEHLTNAADPRQWLTGASDMARMMYLDTITYLVDDILVKLDRATMSVGLEGRMPFLDADLMACAWSLPDSMRVRGGSTKWALRQVLYRYVPRRLVERPKVGFSIPLHRWLRGPLKEWGAALLDPERLKREGYFDAAQVSESWNEHQSGARDRQYHLWNVLMFQAWLESRGRSGLQP